MPTRIKKPIPVASTMCASCIFREDGNAVDLRPGRLGDIQDYSLKGVVHICHSRKKKAACRGARDWALRVWYRMGLIKEPTDAALTAKIKECE